MTVVYILARVSAQEAATMNEDKPLLETLREKNYLLKKEIQLHAASIAQSLEKILTLFEAKLSKAKELLKTDEAESYALFTELAAEAYTITDLAKDNGSEQTMRDILMKKYINITFEELVKLHKEKEAFLDHIKKS